MAPRVRTRTFACLLLLLSVSACNFRQVKSGCGPGEMCLPIETTPGCEPAQLEITDPVDDSCCPTSFAIPPSPEIADETNLVYFDLSLEQAVKLALQNSKVMRDLGGTVLRQPAILPTVLDPAIAYTDPRSGVEAALSAFDAKLSSRAFFEKNDRAFNNTFFGNGGLLTQDLGNYETEIRKQSATGAAMAFRNVTDYDYNNSVGNRFGVPSSSWTTYLEGEVRQPLMQGAGVFFNRTAGPGSQPGNINGVLISRIRSDVSLAEFEKGTRDLISNVENAYWDLYYTYRDLDSKVSARDSALDTWQHVQAYKAQGDKKGEEQFLRQAEEQYWRFQAGVLDALNGRPVDGTRTNNGSSGGSFRNLGGVRIAERRLRLILGMPINSVQLIRPSDEPTPAPVHFDWHEIANESLAKRPELRTQKWKVKQRELELLANKSFLLPQMDAVARYRWRGFGQSLVRGEQNQYDGALRNLADGDFQEWQLGVEFEMPLGFRRAHAAVRNTELLLARERAILDEQKQQVMFGLSNAVSELKRSFQLVEAQYNRQLASREQVRAIQLKHEEGDTPINVLLEAQRRRLDADLNYYQALVEFALAIKNLHFEKGSLLAHNGVFLTEGMSDSIAYNQAQLLTYRQKPPHGGDLKHDKVISTGGTTDFTNGPQHYASAPASTWADDNSPMPTLAQPAANQSVAPLPYASSDASNSSTLQGIEQSLLNTQPAEMGDAPSIDTGPLPNEVVPNPAPISPTLTDPIPGTNLPVPAIPVETPPVSTRPTSIVPPTPRGLPAVPWAPAR